MVCAEPLLELFTVHRAIEKFLKNLVELAVGGDYGPELKERVDALQRVLLDHCQSESEVLIPTLKAKACSRQELRGRLKTLDSHENDFETVMPMFGRISSLTVEDKYRVRKQLLCEVHELDRIVRKHLTEEEQSMESLINACLGKDEQGKLLVATVSPAAVRWMMEVLSAEEKLRFMRVWNHFANNSNSTPSMEIGETDPQEDCEMYDPALDVERQAEDSKDDEAKAIKTIRAKISADFPSADHCTQISPLMELHCLRFALYRDLKDVLLDVRDMDMADPLQLRALGKKVDFLRNVHVFFTRRERSEIASELRKRGGEMSEFDDSFAHTVACFDVLLSRVRDVIARDSSIVTDYYSLKEQLLTVIHSLMKYITQYMEENDTKTLPYILASFSRQEQEALVRNIVSSTPVEFLNQVIPWLFCTLSQQEQQVAMWCLFCTSSKEQFIHIGRALESCVQRGTFDQTSWNQLAALVPALKTLPSLWKHESIQKSQATSEGELQSQHEYTAPCERNLDDLDLYVERGPVREVMRIHKAIRVELRHIIALAKDVSERYRDDSKISELVRRVTFLQRIVHEHARTEDTVVLPALEQRVPGIILHYEDDHNREKERFARLTNKLNRLRSEQSDSESCRLARSIRMSSKTLMADLCDHLEKEETQLWPLLISRFTVEEQDQVVGRIFGQMPSSVLQEMLAWMMRVLSTEEGDIMLQNVLTVTKSTLFEKWLTSWLPVTRDHRADGAVILEENNGNSKYNKSLTQEGHGQYIPERLSSSSSQVRDAVMSVARDNTLTDDQRSRLMQRIMMARWKEARSVSSAADVNFAQMSRPEFVTAHDGSRVFGCRHYKRSCKILAKCCGKLYMCRQCHDEAESHVLDRSSTEVMYCLYCRRSGPIGQRCSFADCNKMIAKYYCDICKLFDDNDKLEKYHCHSCNVCRAGKGLGIDYFHCMKCNMCMSIKYENWHKCIEKSAESCCPICQENLSTSMTPIKYLRCGHLMHSACFGKYVRVKSRCPVCAASLEDLGGAKSRQ